MHEGAGQRGEDVVGITTDLVAVWHYTPDWAASLLARSLLDEGGSDIPLGDVCQNIANILAHPGCSEFIAQLLTEAGRITGVAPYTTSAPELMDRIAGMPRTEINGVIFGGLVFLHNGGVGGGMAVGDIPHRNATAYVFGVRSLTPQNLTQHAIMDNQIVYAERFIHEAIHIAAGWLVVDRSFTATWC